MLQELIGKQRRQWSHLVCVSHFDFLNSLYRNIVLLYNGWQMQCKKLQCFSGTFAVQTIVLKAEENVQILYTPLLRDAQYAQNSKYGSFLLLKLQFSNSKPSHILWFPHFFWVHWCEPVCISFTVTFFHTIALNPEMCGSEVCVRVCVCVSLITMKSLT